VNAVRDHAYAGSLHTQEFFHLSGGEARYGDDQVAMARRLPRLFRKAFPELRRGVLATDDEQIMKCGHGAAGASVDALVQGMKNIGAGRAVQQPAGSVPWYRIAEGTQETMGPVVEQELIPGMRPRQAKQDFTRVHSDSGEISVQAVGSVEGDVH
jgi:hypothetical protein